MNTTSNQDEKIKNIAENYDLKLALLFGSQVSQCTHRESDFDIAYLSAKKRKNKKYYGFLL